MDGLLVILGLALICVTIVLPIVAIVRTARIRKLEMRLAGVEAALARLMREQQTGVAPPAREAPPAEIPAAPVESGPPVMPVPAPQPAIPVSTPAPEPSRHLEVIIGQKWVGWVAVALIFGSASYSLKDAFDNHWIGNLGRVGLGVIVGLVFAWGGLERDRKGWHYLSQVLTAGGVIILYLSFYSAFGYYHLVDQRTAFVFLAVLVAEAHLLAKVYRAPSIAIVALVGGFLVPILLSTGRDQYWILFPYILLLDLGMLALVMARRWIVIGSLAYAGSQLLFWGWYNEHYHPEKRGAVLAFQTAIFLLFALADLAPNLRHETAGWEQRVRLAINPFVFFGIVYFLYNDDHHEWMAILALGLAICYAALGRAQLSLRPSDRDTLLISVGTALTFVTLAIPIQLESNWITIGWSMEALALWWASFAAGSPRLRVFAWVAFALAIGRNLFVDTPWGYRAVFTPVFNRYFLAMAALAACLGGAAWLYRDMISPAARRGGTLLALTLLAAGVFWLGCSVEAYSYFEAQATAASRIHGALGAEEAIQLRWAGELSLSLLWSVFAGLLTASGFRFGMRGFRVAGLVLFGVTLLKVVFMDISQLRQFYRIIALLALGLVLLAVAWAYQRLVRREQTS